MWRWTGRIGLVLTVGGILGGQGISRMKNTVPGHSLVDALDRSGGHWIIEPGPATPVDIGRVLAERGAQFVRAIPDAAFIISAPLGTDLSDLHLLQARRMHPEEKISTAVQRADSAKFYVVEFHPDVTDADSRSVLRAHGIRLRENPDLLSGHFLIHARRTDVVRLAEADEVAYIFPASRALIDARPVRACPGALTYSGTVGQYIATYGDGWDGPGRGGAALLYAYAKLTEKQPRSVVTSVLDNVMAEWARYAKLTFAYTERTDGPRTLTFLFAPGAHGDSFPFDGPGKVLAHTFYPAPPNPEPIAGDLHFDDDEHWAIGVDIDLFSVVLHEMGHALGLGHADQPGAVMYPYYSRVTKLAPADITAIQQLYAAPGEDASSGTPLWIRISGPATSTTASVVTLSGTTSGGSGEVQVTWRTDTGASGTALGVREWSIPAVPLATGRNVVTVIATDARNITASQSVTITRTEVSPTALQVSITSPASGTVTAADVTVSGTASSPAGVSRVRWSNSSGGSGEATGTTTWTARITLQPGQNVITVTAVGTAGAETSATVTLTYNKSAPANDTTAPTLGISTPVGTTVSTSAATIRFTGTARDNVGVIEVNWSTSTGNTGVASGTASWSADVPLLVGNNTVTVRAKDAAGNVGWRSVIVTRR